MSRTIPWLALLLAATTACSEGDGPVDVPIGRGVDDAFTMTLPAFRPLTVTSNEPATPNLEPVAASQIIDPALIPDDFRARMQQGMLTTRSSWADAGIAADHEVAYGMAYGTSRGNYYRNSVQVTLRYNGSTVASVPGEESEWSFLHLPVGSWGMPAAASIGVGGTCGHEVFVSSRHEAELRLIAALKLFTLLAETTTSSDSHRQPPCAVGGQGGGSDESEQWYICYWVDVYDAQGSFLYRQDLGCEAINAS
jgi:hypothetical protein